MQSFHGVVTRWQPNKGFPPCLRRSGFTQAGLKLRYLTACSVSQRKWFLFNHDTVSRGWGDQKRGGEINDSMEMFKL
jgi:hypothetical protein